MMEGKNLNCEIVRRLSSRIETPESYILRRVFGKCIEECGIREVMAFMQVVQTKLNAEMYLPERNAELLVAGLFYENETNHEWADGKTYVRFEHLLGRLHNTMSASDERTLKKLIGADFDNNGMFSRLFARAAKRAVKFLHSNETIDYCQLLDDLKKWNSPFSRKIKLRWAEAMLGCCEL